MAKTAYGTCKLTGDQARFIKAHILPRALTRLNYTGDYWWEGKSGYVVTRRLDSWYDKQLVTLRGEQILTELDTFGIAFLRKHALVWSGWNGLSAIPQELAPGFETEQPFWLRRLIDTQDAVAKLRIFFLSLLWRAGTSTIEACSEVNLTEEEEAKLRGIITKQIPDDPAIFPVTLTQIATVGPPHNLSPLALDIPMRTITGEPTGATMPIYRFYLNGLIIYFARNHGDATSMAMALGSAPEFIACLVPYAESWQDRNFRQLLSEVR